MRGDWLQANSCSGASLCRALQQLYTVRQSVVHRPARRAGVSAGGICAAEQARRAAARVAAGEEAAALARAWRDLQRGLAGERGLWRDEGGNAAAAAAAEPPHWKLDKFEDASRRCAAA